MIINGKLREAKINVHGAKLDEKASFGTLGCPHPTCKTNEGSTAIDQKTKKLRLHHYTANSCPQKKKEEDEVIEKNKEKERSACNNIGI